MKSNGIDNGIVTGLTDPSTFVGAATGMLNNEQMISDTNTFIFTVKTNAAVAATRTVQLPLVSTGTYNFWVDWGDGRRDYVTSFAQIYRPIDTVARTHTYQTVGTYTIKITGLCRGWSYFGLTNERPKLLSIERFGCLELLDDLVNGQYFANCNNLQLKNVKDTLSTTYLTSMVSMFGTSTVSNININLINNWDVSRITNMLAFFQNCTSFNDVISNWNVSQVTNMSAMFSGATNFNQDISNWNVSSVTSIEQIFYFANSFNQPIGSWNVSNVTNMVRVFSNATSFNQDISSWNTGNVTSMGVMFENATSFNQNIGNWNVSKVTNLGSMFNNSAFNNGESSDIDNWDINTISPVTMLGMFQSATAFNQPIGSWDVSQVTSMGAMFSNATIFNQPLSNWERIDSTLANVTSMTGMFQNATNFNQPIGNWNTSKVTGMGSMFSGATAFNQDIGAWNIGAVTNIASFMNTKTPATFSTANLDAIYIGWSSRPSNSNLSISFGTANYTAAGAAGKAILLSRGWTIVDGIEV